MASKRNSKNLAFRNSFAFGLIIFGALFLFSGGLIYHIFLGAQQSQFVKNLSKQKIEQKEVQEDSVVIEQDEPQVRVDTVYITKYVTEDCKKKHCEVTETSTTAPKDTTGK